MRSVVFALLVPLLYVGAENCSDDTGGTCNVLKCKAWRHATCVRLGMMSYKCKCPPGSCAVEGACMRPAQKHCPWRTGGTCSVFHCLPYRRAICKSGECVCKTGVCALNGRCVPKSDPYEVLKRHKPKKRDPATCKKILGETCRMGSCPQWTGAQCVGGHCLCGKEFCAVGPPHQRGKQCVDFSVRPSGRKSKPPEPNKVALILSGGGAKGAYEYGLLRGLCENPVVKNSSKSWATAWTKIFGISIGALNAAGMAQFSFEQQCSTALDFLESYWKSIKTTEDVFIAATGYGRSACLSAKVSGENANNWWETGGLCNPDTGGEAFRSVVFADDIRNSGMQLRVGATNVNTAQMTWWNESSPDVVEGAMASGRLAPLLPPKAMGEYLYIDGGFITNTPILQAIEEGAERIMIMFLSPMEGVGVAGEHLDKGLGYPVLKFVLNLILSRMGNEVEFVCKKHPDVQILAYIPSESPGGLDDFSAESIDKMMKKGHRKALTEEPVELCSYFGFQFSPRAQASTAMPSPAANTLQGSQAEPSGCVERGIMLTQHSSTTMHVLANTMCFACGALIMFAFQRQRQHWAAQGADSAPLNRPLLQQ